MSAEVRTESGCRSGGALSVVLALALAVMLAPVSSTAHADSWPVFTGDEFVALFDQLDLPDTFPLEDLHPITGDVAADARIRALAEARGYRPRPLSGGNLEYVDGQRLHPDAAAAWRSLRADAAGQGISLSLVSGHRSVERQRTLFAGRLASAGRARIGRAHTAAELASGAADATIDSVLRYASIPGYSKHHTGFAIDVAHGGGLASFGSTVAFAWMAGDNYRNAKRHGFVPSYPPGVERQGPDPEPWEYVWVGRPVIECRGSAPSTAVAATGGEVVRADPSRFVAVEPVRVLDTRAAGSPTGYLCAGSSIDLTLAGHGSVPAGATSVVLNVTATRAGAAGFVTVWPSGIARPDVSSLNTSRVDQTVPNLVLVPVGTGGAVSVHVDAGTHLLVDVLGYFEASAPVASGRLIPTAPQRVADTRAPDGEGFVAAGSTRRVVVVPDARAGEVGAVVVNITATDTDGPGYVVASTSGRPPGTTSTVNFDAAGQQVANLAIVEVDESGAIDLTTSGGGAHLVVDVVGLVTGPTADVADVGLFVPRLPTRIVDTRVGGAPVAAGATLVAPSGGPAGDAVTSLGTIANVTVVEAAAPGHVSVWAGGPRPDVSTVNASVAGETRANAALVAVGGGVAGPSIFSSADAHVLVDVFGVLTP